MLVKKIKRDFSWLRKVDNNQSIGEDETLLCSDADSKRTPASTGIQVCISNRSKGTTTSGGGVKSHYYASLKLLQTIT
jgi:hypothetical protein